MTTTNPTRRQLIPPRPRRAPGLKFRQAGQSGTIAVTGLEEVHASDFKSGEKRYFQDGQPILEPVIHGLWIDGTAVVTVDKNDRPPGRLEPVTLWVAGATKNRAWKDAAADGLAVGDVVDATWTSTERSADGYNSHIFEYRIRPTDDPEIIGACEQHADAMPAPQADHDPPRAATRPEPAEPSTAAQNAAWPHHEPPEDHADHAARVEQLIDRARSAPDYVQAEFRQWLRLRRISLTDPVLPADKLAAAVERLATLLDRAALEEPF